MDFEAISVSRQLRASELDVQITNYRDSIHMLGALEAWLAAEGASPWDESQFTYGDGMANFAHGGGYWTARFVESLNFPSVQKMSLALDLVTVPMGQSAEANTTLIGVETPHFTLRSSLWEGDLLISAVTHVVAEPKNMQLAIGVAINDILSVAKSLTEMFDSIPGSDSLLNY